MADGDLYRRAPSYAWNRTFRQISGGAAPHDLGRPVRIALCHTLRHGKGLQGLGRARSHLAL